MNRYVFDKDNFKELVIDYLESRGYKKLIRIEDISGFNLFDSDRFKIIVLSRLKNKRGEYLLNQEYIINYKDLDNFSCIYFRDKKISDILNLF